MATSPSKKSSTGTPKKPTASSPRQPAAARSAERADKSVEAFRDALERSVSLSRERIQEVVDDAVKRGRMTRDDANEMVSKLVSRGRRQTEDLVKDLERLLGQVERTAGRVAKTARVAADEPLAQAAKLRRKAGVGSGFPIIGYDELNVAQVNSRLEDLKKPELRKVRTYEKNNKVRKSILDKIETKLG